MRRKRRINWWKEKEKWIKKEKEKEINEKKKNKLMKRKRRIN